MTMTATTANTISIDGKHERIPPLSLSLSLPEPVPAVLEAGFPGDLSAEQRSEALSQLKNGELASIRFNARVFTNTTPNRNFLRFFDKDMPKFAGSYVGAPFLRNHDTHDIDSREGKILSSRLEGDWITQEIEITTEKGMKAFLEGQIDRFSVGWFYKEVKCSVCGNAWLSENCYHWPGRSYAKGDVKRGDKAKSEEKVLCELLFVEPEGKEVSAVNAPAVPGTGLLAQLMAEKEGIVGKQAVLDAVSGVAPGTLADEVEEVVETQGENDAPATQAAVVTPVVAPVAPVDPWLAVGRETIIEAKLTNARLSAAAAAAVRAQLQYFGDKVTPAQLDSLIEIQRKVDHSLAVTPVKGMGPRIEVETGAELAQQVVDYLLGVEGAKTPPGNYRKISDLYLSMTHDYDWHGGKWNIAPDSSLASATTGALPALVVNALQKVLFQYYGNLQMYRWYEKISSAMPHDGTTQDVTMITLGGMTDLPVVGEGQAYPEKTIGDQMVKAAFSKFGAYIGITLEMIRKNDIARMQMIPKAMMMAAVRTRSAVVAEIFKMNAGVGPTMSYDSVALFHTSHGNHSTTAFGYAEWGAVRTRIAKQTEIGSGKRLGFLPRYCLVPVDLYDTALNTFGYGAGPGGLPGSPNNDLNVYAVGHPGDPRPEIIHVPEFTDSTDWAAIVAPSDVPVIQIAYANQPPGGTHPTPEIFTVDGPNEGLMFSNDTMPIKIRDWWSVGVATHVGIHKNVVAGG